MPSPTFTELIALLRERGYPVTLLAPGHARSLCPACRAAGRGDVPLDIYRVGGDGVQLTPCGVDQ